MIRHRPTSATTTRRATPVVFDGAATLAGLLLLGACAPPAERFAAVAHGHGFEVSTIRGVGFHHALTFGPTRFGTAGVYHVYLDGDGTPTIAGLPVDDPTPRDPLVLRLMAQDPGAAIHLGRPCYHGLGPAESCTPEIWTDARYGPSVVASLATALARHLATRPAQRIVWFGHSGGGVLAMLLAGSFDQTAAVVTVAANLDVAAWAHHHGHPPLAASLDPARRPPLPARIVQRHYLGGADPVVPPATQAPGPSGPQVRRIVVAGFDHVCCWSTIWPEMLAEVTEAIARVDRSPGRADRPTSGSSDPG